MRDCQYTDCFNAATNVVTRLANKEEQDDGLITWEDGVRVPLSIEYHVCDEHLSHAQSSMHLESLSNQELLKSWADSWRDLMHAHRDAKTLDEPTARYEEITDHVVTRGLGTKDKPPIYGTPTEQEDIYALSDKEVFRRACRVSLKGVVYYGLTLLFIWIVGQFYVTGARYLTWLFLLGVAVGTVMVLIVAGTTIFLLVSRLFTKQAPPQSRYDLGLAGVRLAELAILLLYARFLFVRFVR